MRRHLTELGRFAVRLAGEEGPLPKYSAETKSAPPRALLPGSGASPPELGQCCSAERENEAMRLITKGWVGRPSWHRFHATLLGKCYHRAECPLLGQDSIAVTHADALAKALMPCAVCKPPPCWGP